MTITEPNSRTRIDLRRAFFALLLGTAVGVGTLSYRSSVVLDVGESTVIFNSFESVAPAGDPGGFGIYTAFPQIVLGDTANELIAIYYRGTGHAPADEVTSHRRLRSITRGRTWDQLGAEITLHTNTTVPNGEAARIVNATRLPNGRIVVIFNTLDINPATAVPRRVTFVRYSDDDGATWSASVNVDRHDVAQTWRHEETPSTWTDETADSNSLGQGDVQLFPTTEEVNDAFYVGYTEAFGGIVWDPTGGTQGAGGAVAWEYCSANSVTTTPCDTWSALSGVTDGTTGFTAALGAGQQTRWTVPGTWIQASQNGETARHYIRARVTTVYTTNPITSVAEIDRVFGTDSVYSASDCIVPSGTTLVCPIFTIQTGETRYTSLLIESPTLDGARHSWTRRGTIAQDPSPSGLQYESPHVNVLDDGRWMALIREDTTGLAYRVYSNDAGVTWGSIVSVFPTRRIARWVQTDNGTVVAVATPNTGAGTRVGQLYWSTDRGGTWQGPIEYLPTQWDTATNDQEEAGLIEVAPNIVGIISGQERTTNASARLIYTEVGVGIAAPSSFRNSYSLVWPSANGSYADYGNIEYLEGAGEATFEFYIRREANNAQTQRVLTRAGTNQLQLSMTVSSTFQVQAQIASSLTAFASYSTVSTMALDVEYHVVVRYLGTCTPSTDCDTNAERLRVWLNEVEDTGGTYSGTVPATMRSPDTTAVTRLGSYAVTANQELRDTALAFVRVWPVAIPVAQISNLYNGRVPLSHADAAAIVGANAIFSLRLNNDYVDERGFLGAPTITGSPAFSQRWVP